MLPYVPYGEPDERPVGYTYCAVLVRAAHDDVLHHLARIGFTGVLGPQEGAWVVAVPRRVSGHVAPGRELAGVGLDLSQLLEAPALTVSVREDRVLALDLTDGPRRVASYVSDPTYGLSEEEKEDVFPEPQGVEHAEAVARTLGHPDAAEELAEVLGQVLDDEEEIESERLSRILRLLDLPRWVVAARNLPRDVPGGPARAELVRVGTPRDAASGRVSTWLSGAGRRVRRR